MIKMKKLLFNEQNDKSRNEMIMDVIGEFLELRDDFDLRMNKIEKMLNKNYKIKIIQQCFVSQIEKLTKFYNKINVENHIFNFSARYV